MRLPASSAKPPQRIARRLPKGLAGVVFWLAIASALLPLLRPMTGALVPLLTLLQIVVGLALLATGAPFAWRLVRQRLLWSLRNKLLLTYLLIGVAPLVLLLTLTMISTYIAAGQFAIHLVDSRIQDDIAHLSHENEQSVMRFAAEPNGGISPARDELFKSPDPEHAWIYSLPEDNRKISLRPRVKGYVDGVPIDRGESDVDKVPLGLPPWALHLPANGFEGMVLDGSEVYLVAVHQRVMADHRVLSLLSSLAIDGDVMEVLADGLGEAGIIPVMTGGATDGAASRGGSVASEERRRDAREERSAKLRAGGRSSSISGGVEPPPANLADLRVSFLSTLPANNWDTGEVDNIPIDVHSRPSLLYRQLFGGSLSGIVTIVIRLGLVGLCVLFTLIEVLALMMASRLSRTVTSSVTDLYQATQHIDRGDLEHRIEVTRDDQLAELSRSFNRMSGSLQRLLREQKEKERLQNEISIAQEVQANLFPRMISDLPTLQLHGVCRPARAVSGDYYDFLVFHEDAPDGLPSRRETGVGIALGDISGKGISAALLMATLHSAVRAYRFASEELVYSDSTLQGLLATKEDHGGRSDELFESPGRILSLLNRHLYRSTQPEKYATLFLAHYDGASSRLTYSNAGQLPPLVLSRGGAIRRLDCGGTVVGLMDGMQYEEDSLHLQPGDLMVAYSDGVTEPENDFGEFGEERLMDVVRRYRDEPLHVISGHVMQALDAWIGAEEQPDDITLVLARQI